ncbi:MAG: bifunctional phosphopantothenoylcysteine decarboxylase/phosphopantothenate--cysteine ligase CoaBC [Methanomethylophilus sp.]|nr:bifunctional phosphopantothenoylcysteine decarboxylase/phosphopantothenate--cysteine ligase CoaBC [Methanomethylophilus sp.]
MHPSEEIYGEKSNRLSGKTIVLGITGSIAAVNCFSLIRELIRNGAKVIPVMTSEAVKLVAPDAIEFAAGMPPIIELTGQTEHIKYLGGPIGADLFLVYPATANTVSKMANGIADTSVTTMAVVALGSQVPVAVAPAMHETMLENPAVVRNLETLASEGVSIIGPRRADGRAKAASVSEVVAWAIKLLSHDDLRGRRILVIGGRSEEPLDSMRMITNRSTGLMAVALAQRAFERGADVELWMGGCNVPLPDYIPLRRYASVSELVAMLNDIDHDVVIVPAALADFTPEHRVEGKVPSGKGFEMQMKPVPKVLPLIRQHCQNVIGFKAESGLARPELEKRARERLEEYGLKAIVANDVDTAGKTSASMILITVYGTQDITGTKPAISDGILNFVAEKL